MNWFLLLMAFSLAVLVGASASSLLARLRPQWSARRRLLTSAMLLPAVTIVATVALAAAVLLNEPAGGGDMRDLALATVAGLGGLSTLFAFVGGLVGGALRNRGMRR